MSLTLKVDQALQAVNLVKFFEQNAQSWHKLARETRKFLVDQYPTGAPIRADDVAAAMLPVLEVNKQLRAFLQANKLTQKYWFRNFADLVVERTWPSVTK